MIRVIVLQLILGSIASIAIAVCCALISPREGTDWRPATDAQIEWIHGQTTPRMSAWVSIAWNGFGVCEERFPLETKPFNDNRNAVLAAIWLNEPGDYHDRPLDNVVHHLSSMIFQPREFSACAMRSGWPMKCLYGERWLSRPIVNDRRREPYFDHVRGFIIPFPQHGPPTPEGIWPTRYRYAIGMTNTFDNARNDQFAPAVPLLPIWPGLLVNTVFYGSIFWLLTSGRKRLMGRLRLSKGLCPGCRYPIGPFGRCPECGVATPVQAGPSGT